MRLRRAFLLAAARVKGARLVLVPSSVRLLSALAPALDVLEAALAKSAWLAGPAFSVADVNVAAALYRGLAIDLGKWPHLNAWLHRCWERPAAKRARAMREGK